MADLTVVKSDPLPSTGLSVVSSQPLQPKLGPGMKDEDIIKQYGYDPDEIKKSSLYVGGHLASQAADTKEGNSYASKLVEGAGEGAYKIPAGVFQFLVHAANKLGIASDADVKYNDLLEKVHRDAYLQRTGGDPSKLGEMVGSVLIPIPGGAPASFLEALGKGAAIGAASSVAQPSETKPGDSYFEGKLKDAGVGALTGAATGGILHGAAASVGKALNYKNTKLPEEVAANIQNAADTASQNAKKVAEDSAGRILQEKQLAQQAADKSAGVVLQAKSEAADKLAQLGSNRASAVANLGQASSDLSTHQAQIAAASKQADADAEHAAQVVADGVGTKASLATQNLRDAMGSTPFNGTQNLIKAAAKGDGRAGAVLKQLQDAGDNPDKIQQASIQLRNWTTRQQASSLYDQVGKIAEESDLSDVVMSRTNSTIRKAISEAESAKIPDKSLIDTLREVKKNINPGQDGSSPDNSYNTIRKFDDDLGSLIRSGQKGTNALVNDTSVPVLNQIRQAVRGDLSGFTKSNPELGQVAEQADEYYKSARVPFKQPDIAKAGTAVDADSVYDGLIRSGGGDKAQRYYNALDDKGRAAVRYQMTTDAVNAATDPARGTFDPEKFYTALNKVSDAHGVFFAGADKQEMDGLKNLAKQAIQSKDVAKSAGSSIVESADSLTQSLQGKVQGAKSQVAQARLSDIMGKRTTAKNLSDISDRANAEAEDVARTAEGNILQHKATAEDASRSAQALQDQAKEATDAAKQSKDHRPYGSLAIGSGIAAELSSRLGMQVPAAGLGLVSVGATAMKFLTQTEAGRRYLKSASTFPVGSPALVGLWDQVLKQLPAEAGRLASSEQK